MSDDLRTFQIKLDRMFDAAEKQVDQAVKVWRLRVFNLLLLNTPGPGNQWPGTDYIATGRLRAGWRFGLNPPSSVPLSGSGDTDYSEKGAATAARLMAEVGVHGREPVTYVWNEVGYGWYVHEGLEGHEHIGPRPWVQETAEAAPALFDSVRREVTGGA